MNISKPDDRNGGNDIPWYDLEEFEAFPLAYRFFRAWCAYGPKRRNGGTVGGSLAFALLSRWYVANPYRGENYVCVSPAHKKYRAVVDLLDFETGHHTLPMMCRNSMAKKLIDRLLPVGGTFIDVGANQGIFALHAAFVGGTLSCIIALEPQPRLARALAMSGDRNGFAQLKVLEKVATSKEGKADFFVPSTGSGLGSLTRMHAEQSGISSRVTVDSTTLDRVMATFKLSRMDLIKIDVEGTEKDVLIGAERSLRTYFPYVIFEHNPSAQLRAGYAPGDIIRYLESCGYSRFLEIANESLINSHNACESNDLKDILAIPASKVEEFARLDI